MKREPSKAHAPLRVSLSFNAALHRQHHTLDLIELRAALRALADAQSILSAAQMVGTTYRTFWGRLEEYEAILGAPVVEKRRGRGTQLTALGRALLKTLDEQLGALFEPDAERSHGLAHAIEQALGGALVPIRLAASHDFAIAQALQETSARRFEARYTGSAHAIRALLTGEAEVAGFHSPLGDLPTLDPSVQALKSRAGYRCAPIMEREQGIMVARANPRKIRALADLAKPGVRFVNRQRGSGTRTLFDALLISQGIQPSKIDGYGQEEFTHQAVAAIIAADGADAGIGLRAAAARFGLDFVSLGWETYYLAASEELFDSAPLQWLQSALASHCAKLEGYRTSGEPNRERKYG
jgi:putative molybdopterin biosynthesis protein